MTFASSFRCAAALLVPSAAALRGVTSSAVHSFTPRPHALMKLNLCRVPCLTQSPSCIFLLPRNVRGRSHSEHAAAVAARHSLHVFDGPPHAPAGTGSGRHRGR